MALNEVVAVTAMPHLTPHLTQVLVDPEHYACDPPDKNQCVSAMELNPLADNVASIFSSVASDFGAVLHSLYIRVNGNLTQKPNMFELQKYYTYRA